MNKELIGFLAVLWLVGCLVLDIFIYKRTKRWLIRFLPAIVKGVCVILSFALCGALFGSMFTEGIPAEQDYLMLLIVLMFMGLWIDLMAWFFSSNPFSKRKINTFIAVILCFMLFAAGAGILGGGGYYRSTKNGGSWSLTFSDYSSTASQNMNLGDEGNALLIQVATETGSVDIVITDMDGNIIYSDYAIVNDVFTLDATGEVKITVTANECSGKVDVERVSQNDDESETN